MPTPPCTAITKAGKVCGKTTGTQPDITTGEPRCFSHVAKAQRLRDPKARIPIKTFRTSEDVNKVAAWVMARAAENHLSAPSANAVTAAAKVWLRNHEAQTGKKIDLVLEAADELTIMTAAFSIPPERFPAFEAAHARFFAALDQLRELQPNKRESSEDATARRERREAQEHREVIAALDPDDLPLDSEVTELLGDATTATETEDE